MIQVFTDHVRALITIDGANICVDKSFMLKESARLGLIELAESLITHETPQEDLDVALVEFCAIDDRNLDMAKFLLDKGADPSFDDSRLLWTCTINKYTEMAMLFLKDPRVDPNGPFRVHPSLSFFSGPEPHTFIIQQYINDPRFDPSQHSQQVLEPIRKYLA